jgi:hypothetical protein
MKVDEVAEEIGSREVIIPARVRTIDKHGRIYVGVDHAHKKGILLFVELKDGDVGRFS